MKIQKLSLNNVKTALTRAELKKIMAGGSGCGGYGAPCGNVGYPVPGCCSGHCNTDQYGAGGCGA